jgi:hypothetical protein
MSEHRGVSADDPRNAGPIEFFRPKKVEPVDLREALAKVLKPDQVEALLAQYSGRLVKARPPPPLCQPLETHPDPYNGLGTHPDIVDEMWAMDKALPRPCRHVFRGGPALVHPDTGVVFCVGFGTVGFVMRLPPDILAAGPEWRFIAWNAPPATHGRARPAILRGEAAP